MQKVLIAGAGKSASFLINYMLEHASNKWQVIVMDSDANMVYEKLNDHPKGQAAIVDVHDTNARQKQVKESDIVLSLLPASLHILLAKDCLKFGKNLITPSYCSEDIKAMDEAVKKAGLLFMCEMGLDPGIDHMSAANIIMGVRKIAGEIKSFESACGSLIAPDSDDNPWHYKISWNPKNVTLAGKDGARWLENGQVKQLDYQQLFENPKETEIPGLGTLTSYPNRDSVKYRDLYDLEDVPSLVRTTLRYPGFIKGWNIIVKALLTDTSDKLNAEELTYSGWVAAKTGFADDDKLKNNFKAIFKVDNETMKRLEWLGIFQSRLINGHKDVSSAEILQGLLEQRFKIQPVDNDLVVMQHRVKYERRGVKHEVVATMQVKGKGQRESAISKTVGLPMGILAKRILNGKFKINEKLQGVHIPVMKEVYKPVLKELQNEGVDFEEEMT